MYPVADKNEIYETLPSPIELENLVIQNPMTIPHTTKTHTWSEDKNLSSPRTLDWNANVEPLGIVIEI